MRKNVFGLLVLTFSCLLLPRFGFAAPEQLVDSWYKFAGIPSGTQLHQIMRVDTGGLLTSTSTTNKAVVGEGSVEDGDWSKAIPAFGYTQAKIIAHEWDTGAIVNIKLWNCYPAVGASNTRDGTKGVLTSATVGIPGSQAPSVPAAAGGNPGPKCVDLHLSSGVTQIGTTAGVIEFTAPQQPFAFLILELDDITTPLTADFLLQLER